MRHELKQVDFPEGGYRRLNAWRITLMAQPDRTTDAGSESALRQTTESSTLSSQIFGNFSEVQQIFKSITSTSALDNAQTMREFDAAGQFMICENRVSSLPVDFSEIPESRRQELRKTADDLISKYTSGESADGDDDGKLSFHDIADVMKDIAKMDNLSEVEKCALWSQVHRNMYDGEIPITNDDENPSMIDSWKGSSDPWHALISLNDGYHADHLINMTPEAATQAILDHENGAEADRMGFWGELQWRTAKAVLGVNQGDINASEGQLKALRELRSQGTFAAYAAEWQRQFVRADVDAAGNPR